MQWFAHKDCTALRIDKHRSISKHEVIASVRLEDAAAVQRLVHRIEQIPPNGDEMKDFGPDAEHIDLSFTCGAATDVIEIYQKRFKTPSTGFNGRGNAIEAGLYADIDALLFPDLGKRMLKAKDLELHFPRFAITYLGAEHTDSPATVSVKVERYRITPKNGAAQTVEISSGQLPPAPKAFTVAGAKLTLLPFESKQGERLFPDYFQIVK